MPLINPDNAGNLVTRRYLTKLSKVEKIFMVPCSVQPEIWVLGYFVGLPQLLWSLQGPDCLDQAYGRFARPHSKKRTPLLRVQEQQPPVFNPGFGWKWWTWRGAELAQKIGWYFLVVDSVLDWVIVGTSQAYKYQGCIDPTGAWSLIQMDHTTAFLPGDTFGRISAWQRTGDRVFIGGPSGILTAAGYNPSVTFTLRQEHNVYPGLKDAKWSCRLVDYLGGIGSPEFTPTEQPDGSHVVQHFAYEWGFQSGIHDFGIEVTKDFGDLTLTGSMTANGGPKQAALPSACGGTKKLTSPI